MDEVTAATYYDTLLLDLEKERSDADRTPPASPT
jgi:hypothetical protein